MYNPHQLLELQEIDTLIAKYNAERDNLPEKNELSEVEKKIKKLNAIKGDHGQRLKKALAGQKKLEDDLDLLSIKIEKEEKRLYDGSVSSPKELKALQDEIAALKTAGDDKETTLLELIEDVEKMAEENNKLERAGKEFLETKNNLLIKINEIELLLNEKINEAAERRKSTAKNIAEDVIVLYEKLRKDKNGLAVAVLHDGTCGGCNISLPAQELYEITDPAKIWRCGHCRRILVKP